MGVDVYWRNARGEELDHALDVHDHFARSILHIQGRRSEDFPMLQSIDVYANRVFTPPQTETLAAELERVRSDSSVDVRIHLGRVISLARAARSVEGSYLECVGD